MRTTHRLIIRFLLVGLLVVPLVGAAACGSVDSAEDGGDDTPDGAPAPDAPPATIDAAPGLDAFACTANAFIACEGDAARVCNDEGTDTVLLSCAAGCNVEAGRCNECEVRTNTCMGEELHSCGEDGLFLPGPERCALGCLQGGEGELSRCRTLDAMYVADTCLSPPIDTTPKVVDGNETIDVSVDDCAALLDQPTAGGATIPQICVLRFTSLDVQAGKTLKLSVSGANRAVALVVDGAVNIAGLVDASADGLTAGPGGVFNVVLGSGGAATNGVGGGGSGNQRGGAAGADATLDGGQFNGGVARDLSTLPGLFGGARQSGAQVLTPFVAGGGGGGALTIVSCKGAITVATSGQIDVGGGGGNAGQMVTNPITSAVAYPGGGGGGAGGFVVLQAAAGITIDGAIWANGGGGGGGGTNAGASGSVGGDGVRSTSVAAGGNPATGGGAGGNGGTRATNPAVGKKPSTTPGRPGGGGGSPGRAQLVLPAGVSPVISATATSAINFDPTVVVAGE